MKKIINFEESLDDIKDVKIFFGKHDGIQRFDRYKYPITDRLIKVQQGATWFPREVNFGKDRAAFSSVLSPEFQTIYKANLLFQTAADSLANRFLDNVLSQYVTSPEWEAVLKWQAHFELIHSDAYSWNIREVFSNPEQFFNEGFKTPEIRSRLDIEIKSYSELEEKLLIGSLDDKKKALLEVIVRQYVLESIRFFVSFLYTFKINELNSQVLQGSENNIILIANDEQIHVSIFKALINTLRTNPSEEFSHLFDEDFNNLANSFFQEVIDSELEWFKYLSSIQEIQGFTEDSLRAFLEFYAGSALDGIKIASSYSNEPTELTNFFKTKINIRGQKSLAQETDLLSYSIGVLTDGGFLTDDLTVTLP